MKRRGVVILLLVGLMAFTTFGPLTASVSAATPENCRREVGGLGFPTWYKYLEPQFNDPDGFGGPLPGECDIKFEFPEDIGKVLLAVVEILLRVSGVIAVGYVVFGGIKFIMSQGEPDKTKSAKNTVVNALVGTAVAIVATALVNFVGRSLI